MAECTFSRLGGLRISAGNTAPFCKQRIWGASVRVRKDSPETGVSSTRSTASLLAAARRQVINAAAAQRETASILAHAPSPKHR